jgi:hypothetical protein
MITISSTTSNRTLHIRRNGSDGLDIELGGFPVSVNTTIWCDTDDITALIDFFTLLGNQQQPWSNQKHWSSLEGECTLSATCSSLGVVMFQVMLRGQSGSPEEWQVTAGITSAFGQLAQLASDILTH